MADVTGPISSLPGSRHFVPPGTVCDDHPDRLAVARIQGETDSFGCEMVDLCQECLDNRGKHKRMKGRCDWCKSEAYDLRHHRDFEEGTCGPVYMVCGACISEETKALAAEFDADYEDYDDY